MRFDIMTQHSLLPPQGTPEEMTDLNPALTDDSIA